PLTGWEASAGHLLQCPRPGGYPCVAAGNRGLEASPSLVYGARLLSGLRVKPLAGSNPAASATLTRAFALLEIITRWSPDGLRSALSLSFSLIWPLHSGRCGVFSWLCGGRRVRPGAQPGRGRRRLHA